MKTSATKIKTHFGQYLDMVEKGDVIDIERSGKKIATLISYAEYQHLKALDEIFLKEKILRAEQQGYLSDTEAEQFFNHILNRLANDIATETE